MSGEAVPSAFTEILEIRGAVEAILNKAVENGFGRARERILFEAKVEQLLRECNNVHQTSGLDVLIVVQSSRFILKFETKDPGLLIAEKSSQGSEEKLYLKLS